MPFVTDIAGPQRPVQTWPTLATGALRRTSSIDTHPAEPGDSDWQRRRPGRPFGVNVLVVQARG